MAAMLGAEEFGFATSPLIALGCIMMRKCHLNTCPVGIATQDPELRKKFAGKPEHVVNFFFLLAEEMREYMASMGFRTLKEMIGRSDMLRVDESALHSKTKTIDLGPILTPAAVLAPGEEQFNTMGQDHFSPEATGLPYYPESVTTKGYNLLDDVLIEQAATALESGSPVTIAQTINNRNRSVGAMLSNELSKRHGGQGLPDGTITVNLTGHTGQSFGFTLAPGIAMHVTGDANDGCGKGLSGGEISVAPGEDVMKGGLVPEEHVVLGNCALYGATRGRAFFRGKAGERFCVRNSGALAVVEGIGDHGCEYMTGGRMVCLGETGINFGAGMSGGVAYIYDTDGSFPGRVNLGMVELETVDTKAEADELKSYLELHADRTGSTVALSVLSDFDAQLPKFVKVMPTDYKRVLQQMEAEEPVAAAAA
jgi:glutamate synthase domain-containing protein 3